MKHTAMPKYVIVDLKQINQHTSVLGSDQDNSKLDSYTLESKHRNALKLFEAIAGHGLKGE